jgi:hypothetical protein
MALQVGPGTETVAGRKAAAAAERAEQEQLFAGPGQAEFDAGFAQIADIIQGRRGQIASVLGAGGAPFDPAAFARATAPLAGAQAQAVGAFTAQHQAARRNALIQYLQFQFQMQQQQQQMQMQRQQQQGGLLGGLGQGLGFLLGGPIGGMVGGSLGGMKASMTRPPLPPASLPGGFGF